MYTSKENVAVAKNSSLLLLNFNIYEKCKRILFFDILITVEKENATTHDLFCRKYSTLAGIPGVAG